MPGGAGDQLSLAFASALITGVVGLLAAWLVVVQRIQSVIDALSLMPAALPGIVVGWG
jgi:iron(III) transport system permease protein